MSTPSWPWSAKVLAWLSPAFRYNDPSNMQGAATVFSHELAHRCRVGLANTILIFLVAIYGCRDSDAIYVNLDKRAELSSVQVDTTGTPFLRIGIAGLVTPTETQAGYVGLMSYLQEELGRPVRLVQRKGYAEMNAMIQAGHLDVALVCPLPYVQGHLAFGMQILAAVLRGSEAANYSYLVVHTESDVSDFEDLRGRTFAFSDPDSLTGWLAPVYQLAVSGMTPDQFFGRYFFTYHHSESLRVVADHMADGAVVDGLVYEYFTNAKPALTERIRIIDRWGPYPSHVVVARPDLESSLKHRLQLLFTSMNKDPKGRDALMKMHIDGFAPIEDSAYDVVREMEAQVKVLASRSK